MVLSLAQPYDRIPVKKILTHVSLWITGAPIKEAVECGVDIVSATWLVFTLE
jgi:hypothetical protein